MARIGRSKSDVGLDNKHSLQYYRRGMMDVLTRRLFPSSSPLFPPLQFDSSRSKRFYEISTTVPGLAFIHNHSKSFDFLSIEILRRRVCIFDSKSSHLIFGTESLRGQSWRVKEGIRPSVSRIPSFHSLFLSSSRVIQQARTRYAKRITMAPLSSPWIITNRDGNGVSISWSFCPSILTVNHF